MFLHSLFFPNYLPLSDFSPLEKYQFAEKDKYTIPLPMEEKLVSIEEKPMEIKEKKRRRENTRRRETITNKKGRKRNEFSLSCEECTR